MDSKEAEVKSLRDRIQFAYEGGLVERFHTRTGIRPNTDSQHSHGVAMLCYFLTDGACSSSLLMAALTHDLAEHFVSDVCGPTKWMIPGLNDQLSELESAKRAEFNLDFETLLGQGELFILKLADQLDGLMWCVNERWLGNRKVELIADRWIKHFYSGEKYNKVQTLIINIITDLWNEAKYEEGKAFDVYEK